MKPKPVGEQSLSAKKAEFHRPFFGGQILQDQDLRSMHSERANKILADLDWLKSKHVNFGPFLEIGAGSVQRSVALINHYQVDGVATDISQDSLRDAPYILSLFGYDRTPLLICCDAYHLPFLPNSFRFVFAYQTLHHFENPIPVAEECYRILGKGGHFFFNEEPMDSSLRRMLRGNRMLSHPPTKLQKMGYRLGLEKVFWDNGALERSLGMVEARFDIDLWRKVLQPFVLIDLEVNRRLKIRSILKPSSPNSYLAGLVGGNVRGLCQKCDGEEVYGDFRQRLRCLDCNSSPILFANDKQPTCQSCGRIYPVEYGVIRMLPKALEDYLVSKEG